MSHRTILELFLAGCILLPGFAAVRIHANYERDHVAGFPKQCAMADGMNAPQIVHGVPRLERRLIAAEANVSHPAIARN